MGPLRTVRHRTDKENDVSMLTKTECQSAKIRTFSRVEKETTDLHLSRLANAKWIGQTNLHLCNMKRAVNPEDFD